jgi:hypothetical protein
LKEDAVRFLQSFVNQNPLARTPKVVALPVDLRQLPSKVQVMAYKRGMIPRPGG